jgi:diaminohydroxyphosphoribosylaminopyrimidine deaminase/5-amino-6-(5-phosphoribosylamino)uracil reductase
VHIQNDTEGMTLALEWAARAMTSTAPNPRVGCVLVREGAVIGAGHTQPPGQAHAEIAALRDAAARGHAVRGATAYVTLEPCNHFGRTPPCSDALVAAGLGRVVAAIEDPNPLVAGQGMAKLAAHGIDTRVGVLADQAYELNIGFFSRMRRGLPWVRMKTAASLDGGTALHNGVSQWITGAEARADGHAWRARAGVILTGIGTVKADDPQMTVRGVASVRPPQRVIVDSRLDIALDARILAGPPCWIVAARPDPARADALTSAGHEVLLLPNADGKVDLSALMRELGRREINEVHVEAGSKLNGSLIREGCVDELLVYLAPCLLGTAQGMFSLGPYDALEQRQQLAFHQVQQIGADLRILARLTAQ